MKRLLSLPIFFILLLLPALTIAGQNRERRYHRRMAFATDTVMVHDPVMAFDRGTYYLLSTGQGLQWATSKDRQTWVVQPTPFIEDLPQWTRDSVPGFRSHVWAPDVVRWHDYWWLAYSCSTFGRNTSAIGLMRARSLTGHWQELGCMVASREKRDEWNAIDPCFLIDEHDQPWLAWGSFWDGIQLAKLSMPADSIVPTGEPLLASAPQTIARRYRIGDPRAADNPTSRYAGRNAIEAPFLFRHEGWYYLFVSWDYCCRGAKSNYRVAVGRSRSVEGPYVDREGHPMLEGGGTLVIEGDGQQWEAAGHCAVYTLPTGEDLFICHGYSAAMGGAALLIQKTIQWTADGWPTLN